MRNLLFVILFLGVCKLSYTQPVLINWETLTDVTFTDKYSEEEDAYYYYPSFGPTVKELKGKVVQIQGFVLVIDPTEDFYVLSKNPFSSCFFCGNGGPESVVELQLDPEHEALRMDDVVTIEGTLKLNADDYNHCNYIIENARVIGTH